MSDSLQHECGVAFLRLRQPYSYYVRKYGASDYGLGKVALLLEKQHNRGQDGAGLAVMKLDAVQGEPYYQLERCNGQNPLAELIGKISVMNPEGEIFLGHLRYGTFGNRSLDACHPIFRESACRNRTLFLAGNFNLTNTSKLFDKLVQSGHHLNDRQDSHILIRLLAHYLEKTLAAGGDLSVDLPGLIGGAAADWDGGFFLSGMIGSGESFVFRDNAGIRPGFYYFNDEIVVAASERPAIQTAFNLTSAEVMELPPGSGLFLDREGHVALREILPKRPLRRCVFERIYFSRGNDAGIHRERRELGKRLVPAVLQSVGGDFENTVFSYIPNTAQLSFHGMLEELFLRSKGEHEVRFARIAVKDAKFRTFITDPGARKELGMHVYDVTYGVIRPGADNLVVLDDSIVRGNTMRNAILPILDRLNPKKIIIGSSSPPICYPDGYGIDMASLGELVAFEAAVRILKRENRLELLNECVRLARIDLEKEDSEMENRVKPIYDSISFEELSREIGNCLKPAGLKAELEVVFQTLDDLHASCPDHTGDWYFSGDYPTPGGNRVVNRALVNYIDHINKRAY